MAFNLSLSNVNQGSPTPLSPSALNYSVYDEHLNRNRLIPNVLEDLSFKSDNAITIN
jgi:hypothetical protein